MSTITPGGVRYPERGDEPRYQALRELGQSIDVPADLAFTGKIRCLGTASTQSWPSTTTLDVVENWTPHGGGVSALGATDQGDACGIFLEGLNDEFLRVSEAGFYFMYANYPFVAQSADHIGRVGLRDPDTGEYYQTRSHEENPNVGFMGAEVTNIVWLRSQRRVVVEAAQNSGGTIGGGNDISRTLFLLAKLRLM